MMKSGSLTDCLRETLAIFDEPGEPWTTPEVAEFLDLGRRSTYARLERLVEQNRIKTKKVGANARVWWRSPINAGKTAPNWSAAAESLIDDVLGDVGIFVLDENFDIAWINGTTERYFGLDRKQIVGRDKRELIGEHIAWVIEDSEEFTETVLATYDDNTYTEHFECHVMAGDEHEERWLEYRSKPIESGEYAGGRVELYYDMTDLKEKERQLEHQRTELRSELNEVFNRINDAVCGLDADWRFTYLNDRTEELVGKTEEELLGTSVWDAFSGDLHRSFRDYYEQEMETQNPVTFEEYSDAAEAWLEVTAYPSKSGLSVYFRDITERKERERALEESEQRYRTLVENFPNGAVAFLNHDLQHTIVGGQGFNNLDFNANDLQDKRMQEVYSEDVLELIEPNYRAALNGTANSFELEVQGRTFEFRTVPLTTDDGDVFAAMAMSQDVTEREQYQERLQALYTSSRGFLTADTTPEISQILTETASNVLDLPGVVFYDYDAEHDRLIPDTTSREADFMREEFPEVPADDSSITGYVFSGGDTQYYENVLTSPNLQMPPDATEMRAGVFVPLGTEGILVAGSRDVDGFDANTRRLVELLATNAEAAYERVASKQELIHRNEQLTALNSLNEVIQEIMDAVINQSTREEIEVTVCEHLADSDSYLFAWVGDVDAATQTVNMRAKAGVEGDFDEVTIFC